MNSKCFSFRHNVSCVISLEEKGKINAETFTVKYTNCSHAS